MSGSTSSEADSRSRERQRLAVGVVGLVAVLAFAVACVAVDRSTGSEPPVVEVRSVDRVRENEVALFEVEVENVGGATASQVQVRAQVGEDDAIDHEVDFLAPGERDDVTFAVPAGTTTEDVQVEVVAWTASQ